MGCILELFILSVSGLRSVTPSPTALVVHAPPHSAVSQRHPIPTKIGLWDMFVTLHACVKFGGVNHRCERMGVNHRCERMRASASHHIPKTMRNSVKPEATKKACKRRRRRARVPVPLQAASCSVRERQGAGRPSATGRRRHGAYGTDGGPFGGRNVPAKLKFVEVGEENVCSAPPPSSEALILAQPGAMPGEEWGDVADGARTWRPPLGVHDVKWW